MTRYVLMCFGMAFATCAIAAPTCTTGTYATYVALGATGCQDGDATFSNFSSLGFTNSGGVSTIPASNILVIPGGTTLAPNLTFEYVNAGGMPTPVSVSVAGQIFSMGFNYQIMLTGASLSSIQMGETFSNTSPGSVSATKNAQIGGGTVFTSTVNDGGISNPSGTVSTGNSIPTTGTGTWTITDTVSLQAQTGSATQNSFENLFTLAATTTTTPEPSTLLMAGATLLGLGLIIRRGRSGSL